MIFLKSVGTANFKLSISHHEEKVNSFLLRKAWDRFPQKYLSSILAIIKISYHYYAFFFQVPELLSRTTCVASSITSTRSVLWERCSNTYTQAWCCSLTGFQPHSFTAHQIRQWMHAGKRWWHQKQKSTRHVHIWDPYNFKENQKETQPLPRQGDPQVRFVVW